MKMQLGCINLSGIPTKIITWGKRLHEINPDEPEDIIVCIPGNPGVTKFYTTYLQTIHTRTGHPVWIVSHAGHDPPRNIPTMEMPSFKSNKQLYDLQGQIEHKRAFINEYVPKNARIHFIGHSIGCYIILQLLKDPRIKEQTVSNYLLFPTIERMAESPNGKLMTRIVRHFQFLIVFFAWIFTLLPNMIKTMLVKLYTTYFRVPKWHHKTIVEFIAPDVLEKVLFMAMDEMYMVTARDDEVLIENKDRLKLYYGATDRWCPQRFYTGLKGDLEDIDAEICTRGYEHAFVLRFSIEMAHLTVDWMKTGKS